jgi:hypothetical protein
MANHVIDVDNLPPLPPTKDEVISDLRRDNKEMRRLIGIFVKSQGVITINDRDLMADTDDGYVEMVIDGKKPYERTYRWVSNSQKTQKV